MAAPESHEPFSLIGGPLHELGRRLGLIRNETNTVLIGLALGWGVWLVCIALAIAQGHQGRLFPISLVGAHARLLLVIPLFFVGESWVTPRMSAFVGTITRWGIVPPGQRSALEREVARVRRMARGWWPGGIGLLAGLVVGWM